MISTRNFKWLLALCIAGLLGAGVSACGESHKSTSPTSTNASSTTTTENSTAASNKADPDKDHDGAKPDEDDKGPPPKIDQDGDSDNNSKSYYDSDDKGLLEYGHAASAAEKQAITGLIKRYYVAAAAEEGAKACSMLYSTYAEAVPEDYGTSPPGPSWARGSTCAAVLTHVFNHEHTEIAAKLPKLKIARIRVEEHRGLVVLSFHKIPASEIRVLREGHTWRVEALVDNPLS